MPALFITILLTLVAGYYILPSFFYEELAETSIYAILSVSNIFFFLSQGYFDVGSELKPLLHTWSLGVEEQFYLLWPLLIYLSYRIVPKLIFALILVISCVSILFCQLYVQSNPTATFFLIPFRAFQFGIGSILVFLLNYISPNKIVREAIAILGVLLLVLSSIYLDRFSYMPSLLSLIPCTGIALVILSTKTQIADWFLSNKIMDVIGKASYSIYLVHWPLIVYYKMTFINQLTIMDKSIVGGTSIILGLMMWKIIETPLRNSRFRSSYVWLTFLLTMVLLVASSIFILNKRGFPLRNKNPFSLDRKKMENERNRYWDDAKPNSQILDGTPDRNIIVLGNSHAKDLIYALKLNGFKPTISFLPSGYKCYNFGALPVNHKFKIECDNYRRRNLTDESWNTAEAIFLHDSFEKENFKNLELFLNQLRSITDAPIYVFGPKMIYTRFADFIIQSSNSIIPKEINLYAKQFEMKKVREDYNQGLKRLINITNYKSLNIHYIDLLEVQNQYKIVSEKTSKLLYFDSNHLTQDGAIELGENLKVMHPYLFI